MPSYRSLARNRDFTALWVGQTVSEIGSRMTMFVFPLITYALTGSAMLAAASEALHLLGLAGMLLPAGVIADRCDRRRVMRLASGADVLSLVPSHHNHAIGEKIGIRLDADHVIAFKKQAQHDHV